MRLRLSVFILALAMFAPALPAQRIQRFELTPFAGYETSGSYPIQNSLIISRLRADANISFGTFLDYSLTPNLQAEFLWAHNPTSYSAQDAITRTYAKAFNTQIDQFQFGGLYFFRSDENKLRPYAAASIGFTHDSNSGPASDRTALAFGLGGGVKYYATRHLGLRADARWLPTYANTGPAIVCDPFGFCFRTRIRNYLERGNFSLGIILRP